MIWIYLGFNLLQILYNKYEFRIIHTKSFLNVTNRNQYSDIIWKIKSPLTNTTHENTLSFVVTSFFDNFLSTILSSSGIRFSSSGLKGVNPKICEEMSTFV